MHDTFGAVFVRAPDPLGVPVPLEPCTYWEPGRAFVATQASRRPRTYEADAAALGALSRTVGECVHLAFTDASEPILFYAHAVGGGVVRAFRAHAGVVRQGDGQGAPEAWEQQLGFSMEASVGAVAAALDLPRSALALLPAPEGEVLLEVSPRLTSAAPPAVVQRFSDAARLEVRRAPVGFNLVFQDEKRALHHGWHPTTAGLREQARVLFQVPVAAWQVRAMA